MAPSLRVVVALLLACGCAEEARAPQYGGRGRVASTRGSAVVMTYDERVAVATHRTSGVVSVLHLDASFDPKVVKTFDVGVEARPWAAVIAEDDDSAYVLLRGEQRVVRIRGLHSEDPELDEQAWPTGAEPTAIAITPSGARVYVANWGEGTLSTFRTSEERVDQATDLNVVLAETGLLGELIEGTTPGSGGIWSRDDLDDLGAVRPGLAHPRALAITDDGDTRDDDETLYVTEFFSQPLADSTETDPDRSRQGLVYAIDVGTGQPVVDSETGEPSPPITLGALDTGFSDAEGSPTACFPNQLMAAAIAGQRLLITSLCASARGPVDPGPGASPENFKTLLHPVIFVVDTARRSELPGVALVLTRMLEDQHGDAEDLRMPLIPNDIAIDESSGRTRAYVTAFGADAVFSVDYDERGLPERIGSASKPFIDLRSPGRLPIGIALSARADAPVGLVLGDFGDVLSVVDRDRAEARGHHVVEGLEDRVDAGAREGRLLFATGLDNWSFKGQAWSSCESCHPEGLSDGVVWRFARGPRRTISTHGTYYGDEDAPTRRMLLWTANVDEVHDVEAIARGVSGGAGGVSWKQYQDTPNVDCRLLYAGEQPRMSPMPTEDCPRQLRASQRRNGLNGSLAAIGRRDDQPACSADAQSCDLNALTDWDHIDAFIRTVRAPAAPTTLVESYVRSGKELFASAGCASCHGGPGWTVSRVFYEPSDENNGVVPIDKPAPESADIDAIRGALRVQTYTAPLHLARYNQPLAKAMESSLEPRASFRAWAPLDATDDAALTYAYGGPDQINCALRSVGTFPVQPNGVVDMTGIVAPGAPPVSEVRRVLDPPTMPTGYADLLAGGGAGFNVPTLTGLALAGSYFHAGNARTLEELFHEAFAQHHQNPAAPVELTRENLRDLVSYLLSIDESDATEPVALQPFPGGATFDPDFCNQL